MPHQKWKPIMLVHIYRYAKAGMSEIAMYKALGVSRRLWHLWWTEKHPEIKEVIELAHSEGGETLVDYLFRRLSPEVRDVWARITMLEKEPNGIVKIEQILSDHGVGVRQQLFLHALMSSAYSPSWACAKVNIDKSTFRDWKDKDPRFAEMVNDVEWHKKNFFEECLVDLVASHDTAAVLFANKTVNRDRGFGQHVQHEVSGQVLHGVVDMSDLIPYMTKDVQDGLLVAIQKRDEAQLQARAILPVEKMLEMDMNKLPGG
jgi:hypothetical protein